MPENRQAETYAHVSPLRRARGIECHQLDDELMVTDLPADRAHFLNPSMAAVWKLCDGTRPADQIAESLAEIFDCSQTGDLYRTVEEALETLGGLDLLRGDEQADQGARPAPAVSRSSTNA